MSRHRRVFKEVGAVTGITFIDHPKGHGVVVSELQADGACAKSGVRLGDHVVKINGERPNDRNHAVALCDAAWTAEADGQDRNKDRLKFSLHFRTQDFAIGRQRNGLSAGALVGVEVISSSTNKMSLLGGKKLEETGLLLEDSPSGYGALVGSVLPDSPAHVAGLEAGLTIASVGDKLCVGGHREVAKMVDAELKKKGVANLVCHLKKSKDDDDHV